MKELDVVVRYVSNQINATPPCADGIVRVTVETVTRWVADVLGPDHPLVSPRRVVTLMGDHVAWDMRRRPR